MISEQLSLLVSDFRENFIGFTVETENLFDRIKEDREFCEVISQLDMTEREIAHFIGRVVWNRLKKQYGENADISSKKENQSISMWAEWSGIEYHRLVRLVGAAKTREIHSGVEKLSITAQHEIGLNLGEGEPYDAIERRLKAVETIDPKMNNTTDSVRAVKVAEKGGVTSPRLVFSRKDDILVIMGMMSDKETGEVDAFIPIMKIEMIESDYYKDEAEAYVNFIINRCGIKETQ